MIGFGAEAGLWEEWKALHIPSRIILTYLSCISKSSKEGTSQESPQESKEGRKEGRQGQEASQEGRKEEGRQEEVSPTVA